MALPSGPSQDLLRIASARRSTLSHHPRSENTPLLDEFALSEKTLISMHVLPEDIMT